MEEEDGYIEFSESDKTLDGKWCVRSKDQDNDGYFFFLAFNPLTRPRVAKPFETAYEIICDTELQAHEELAFYYDYHGDVYPYEQRRQELINNARMAGASQPMGFI